MKTEIKTARPFVLLRDFFQRSGKQIASKVWERIRFRLLAIMRPATTCRRHQALAGKTVVVYTMGKVGSSSVYYTLMKTFPFRRIFHNHFLSHEWLTKRLPGTPFVRNIRVAKPALRRIQQDHYQIYYICMMRDPIGRDLSNVIQNYLANGIHIHDAPLDTVMQRIAQDGHMFFQSWFDSDFLEHIGQPVTAFAFDPKRGYSIHKIDHRRHLLLLKVEAVDRVFEHAISEFLGIDIDPQFRFNDSSEKSEAAFYHSLKKAYRLPRGRLEQIYDAQVVRHFYDDGERKALIEKWVNE